MKTAFTAFLMLPALSLLASCAKDGESGKKVTRERVSHGDPILDKYASNHGYAKSGGQVRSTSDKVSRYAGKTFHGSSDFAGKDYRTSGYTTKRWGGNTSYANKAYQGGTRYDNAPEYAKRQAYYNGKSSSAQGSKYATNGYSTNSAYEQSGRRLTKSNNIYAQRNNLKDPVIIPWQQQNQHAGYSMQQTNEMLGRATEESKR